MRVARNFWKKWCVGIKTAKPRPDQDKSLGSATSQDQKFNSWWPRWHRTELETRPDLWAKSWIAMLTEDQALSQSDKVRLPNIFYLKGRGIKCTLLTSIFYRHFWKFLRFLGLTRDLHFESLRLRLCKTGHYTIRETMLNHNIVSNLVFSVRNSALETSWLTRISLERDQKFMWSEIDFEPKKASRTRLLTVATLPATPEKDAYIIYIKQKPSPGKYMAIFFFIFPQEILHHQRRSFFLWICTCIVLWFLFLYSTWAT